MDRIMLDHPEWWRSHYHGDSYQLQLQRVHSYSDRIRYYWNRPAAQAAVSTLRNNLDRIVIPETLLSDYMPLQYERVRAGVLESKPLPLVFDAIRQALEPYSNATA
jgi:D-tagatose-1,6-bisphosphate aldolase subunit GatZ/KbaZ